MRTLYTRAHYDGVVRQTGDRVRLCFQILNIAIYLGFPKLFATLNFLIVRKRREF